MKTQSYYSCTVDYYGGENNGLLEQSESLAYLQTLLNERHVATAGQPKARDGDIRFDKYSLDY